MNMNCNYKRHFEPNSYSTFNAMKKVRLDDGKEKPSFPAILSYQDPGPNFKPKLTFPVTCNRPKYKVHHKCKSSCETHTKPVYQFKAKPMPNFANPFMPKHYKNNSTVIQEFNLSCYQREFGKSVSMSRCDTPDNFSVASFSSQQEFKDIMNKQYKVRGFAGFGMKKDFKNPDMMDID